jgi:subtilisin family serine protease
MKKKLLVSAAALNLMACGGAELEATEQMDVGQVDVGVLALTADEKGKIPGHYIVTLREGVEPKGFARALGLAPSFVYTSALNGFAGYIPAAVVEKLRHDTSVARIEQDGVVYANQTTPWGITNIGSTTNSTLAGNGSGTTSGPISFVIDTGIDTAHPDLYVIGHVNYAGGPNTDCNGHGTHVAGTVGARDNATEVVGVAPGVAQIGVKVLSCSGSGSWSGVISGMDYVANHSASRKVANMSLGGGFNQSINDAAENMVAKGVAVAVAAGNDTADACTKSPASAPSVLTVAAYDVKNLDASWTNFGRCVDLSAPGVSILSTKSGGGTTTMSGTSMASPHVAGALALYLANNPSASGTQAMTAVKSNTSGTTSKFAFPRLNVANW